jgi:hypothetical protein
MELLIGPLVEGLVDDSEEAVRQLLSHIILVKKRLS